MMKLVKAADMSAIFESSLGCRDIGRPPMTRRHASQRPVLCAAEQRSFPRAPMKRRDMLMHSAAAATALAIQALAARLAFAEDGALAPAAGLLRQSHCSLTMGLSLRYAGANPITGTAPPLSFAMPTQEEGVSSLSGDGVPAHAQRLWLVEVHE